MNGAEVPAAPAQRSIRLLHLEDSELDHALVVAHLRRGALLVHEHRIETRAEFEAAIYTPGAPGAPWDLVISDYHLPGFSGLEALQMLRTRERAGGNPLPFILVSGQIGEETAVEAMRNGASDYLLKNNLSRLAVAVEHAITASETQRARLQADTDLKASRLRLSELAQHLQTSVEAERSAIAREIHDDVGGSLTALKFELDWVRRHARADDASELQMHLGSALELVTHAIDSSQRIMQNLRPAILEQGLVAALQWMTSSFARRTGIACEFRTGRERDAQHERLNPQQRLRLPPGVPLVAYRTAQEALTNASKHAQASKVVVDLSFSAGVLSLEVTDNGRGLDASELEKSGSFGIRGLHERASTVGGWVDLSSSPAGTTLILSVPLDVASGPVTEAGDNLDDESSAWSPL